ncbi:hypothetical protein E4U55_001837 [Claviceps digitariae]|nr:hypothetical protein E4U55_001837 [Claviceps digitariae]
MPSFGRLGKNNRSQHALPEQLSTGAKLTSGGGSASASASASGSQISLLSALAAPVHASSSAEALPQSALSSTTAAPGSSDQLLDTSLQGQQHLQQHLPHARHQQLQHQHQQLQHQQRQLESQQQQQHQLHHQQQQQPPPPPPPHLFTHSGGVHLPLSLQTSSPGGSSFDGHQPQTPIDFDPAIHRSQSQSQRYGARVSSLQQQQQQQQQQQPPVYGFASGSFDDLSGTAVYQQQQQQPPQQQQQQQQHQQPVPASVPPKRSTRQLIKGIFSSSREPQENQQQQPPPQSAGHSPTGPHDNIAGFARRPSKRVSNQAPILKTNPPPPKRFPSDRDWTPQGTFSHQPSPLHEADETDEHSFYPHESNTNTPHMQDSRVLVNQNTVRQVPYEHLDTSPHDQVYQPPDHPPPQQQQQTPPPPQQPQPQPLKRRGTVRLQEQQAQFESLQKQTQQQPPPQQHQHQNQHQHKQQPQEQTAYYDYDQGPRQQPQHHFHYPANSPESPYQPSGEPHIATSQLKTNQQLQNAETISQLSHDSPLTDSDSRSAFSLQQLQQIPNAYHESTPSRDAAVIYPTDQGAGLRGPDYAEMAPPAPGGGPQPARRTQDADKGLRGQVDAPPGPPPGYHRQGSMPLNVMSPAPTPGQGSDHGRSSPQPSSDRDPELEKQFKDLLTKYKNVKRLYFDGKSQIELLNGQVEHLQNAVANQRMSQSRTAWDDSEYSTKFNRLNGAINNLSFNIRKDWCDLPLWVQNSVSADALKTGKQEMTAVGRAVVSRWLVDEVFNRCFHPALDEPLSTQLKEIEMGIRGTSYTMHSQEEFDALTDKVVNWRMVTLDGLQHKLGSLEATENRARLTNKITTNLTTYLHQFLSTPPPPGVEGSTSVIAELAVAIAANLPLESRDVAIMYPLPGDAVQTSIMEVEKTGLPPLEGHKENDGDSDSAGDDSGERDKNGKSMLSLLDAVDIWCREFGYRISDLEDMMLFTQWTNTDKRNALAGRSRDTDQVRFAGFVALEVRGRQVLAKAPVWTMCG